MKRQFSNKTNISVCLEQMLIKSVLGKIAGLSRLRRLGRESSSPIFIKTRSRLKRVFCFLTIGMLTYKNDFDF